MALGSSFLKGSCAGPGAAAVSSSVMPFLKLLMPLATSPMIEEILPLPPNSRSATTRKMSQCQMLKLPILVAPFAATAAFARFAHYCRKAGVGQGWLPSYNLGQPLRIQAPCTVRPGDQDGSTAG